MIILACIVLQHQARCQLICFSSLVYGPGSLIGARGAKYKSTKGRFLQCIVFLWCSGRWSSDHSGMFCVAASSSLPVDLFFFFGLWTGELAWRCPPTSALFFSCGPKAAASSQQTTTHDKVLLQLSIQMTPAGSKIQELSVAITSFQCFGLR